MNTSNSTALKGNLKSLVATGGVLAGAGSASQAAIVHTEINLGGGITISSGGSIYFSLTDQVANTDPDAVNEQFQLYFRFGVPQKPRIQGVADSGAIAGYLGAYYFFASRLTDGTAINNSLTFSSTGQLNDIGDGQWDPGDRGNLGLRFDNGGVKYGWADVSYNANNSLTLYGFAYEDSGAQILAGAVPEPATTGVLAALFAGSVVVFEARRRRKAAKQATQLEPVTAG